ncbi:MAG: hypothetical protein ABSG54_19775 [Terriglobia bacterium]|jgi:hypothetical protein
MRSAGRAELDILYNGSLRKLLVSGGMMEQTPKISKPHEWKVKRVGTTTFAISKPKRKARKLRQTRLKNRRRSR